MDWRWRWRSKACRDRNCDVPTSTASRPAARESFWRGRTRWTAEAREPAEQDSQIPLGREERQASRPEKFSKESRMKLRDVSELAAKDAPAEFGLAQISV